MTDALIEVEIATLNAILDALTECDAEFSRILDTLPVNYPLGSRRKVADLRGNLSYALSQDLPNMIAQYVPVTMPVTPQA